MTKTELNNIVKAVTENILASMQAQPEAPAPTERERMQTFIGKRVKSNGVKAQARKDAKKPTAKQTGPSITDLVDTGLDALLTRACAEAHAADSINAKRIPLCDDDLRVLITRPTNAAIKMFCRDKDNGMSISDASRLLVSMYNKKQGKGAAKALLAEFA